MSSLIVEVCKIESIEKHPNADRLSIVKIKDWHCIVGLDQYKVNDLVIFVPPDCIIPDDIIDKYNLEYLKHNGRTSTVKLRGYISQGLVLDLPEGKWKVGDNAVDKLGITKYEPPVSNYSVRGASQVSKKRINPNFHKYTNIEDINNFNNIFSEEDEIVITEKIHGANFRAGLLEIDIRDNTPFFDKISMLFRKYILRQKYEFVYGSHNVQITNHSNRKSFYGEDVWGAIAKKYNMKDILIPDMIIYGEVFGEGIQDLTYGVKGHDLIIFDVKYQDKYWDWEQVKSFCNVSNLKYVPELYVGNYSDNIVKECTGGKSIIAPDQIREGCVTKTLLEENHPRIGRKILKSRSVEYLTRKDGTEYE